MILISTFIRKAAFYSYKAILHLTFKIIIYGKENIPQVPSALIVANHQSYLDGFIVGLAFFDNLINLRWIISKANYQRWFLKPFWWFFQPIVVNGTVEKAKKTLSNNNWVVIFPEGAGRWCFVEKDAKIKPGHGAAAIALSTGTTIIPITLTGTDKVLPADSFKLHPERTITIRIGKPFKFETIHHDKIEETVLEKTTSEIMNKIYQPLNQTVEEN